VKTRHTVQSMSITIVRNLHSRTYSMNAQVTQSDIKSITLFINGAPPHQFRSNLPPGNRVSLGKTYQYAHIVLFRLSKRETRATTSNAAHSPSMNCNRMPQQAAYIQEPLDACLSGVRRHKATQEALPRLSMEHRPINTRATCLPGIEFHYGKPCSMHTLFCSHYPVQRAPPL